ncbi:hypothetical protein Goari_019316 [Gossypium aridum]|uniref:DUF4283 domain-containing protein n=1 Tax=Gossypium aridum TaxID=34290 RepID=A0A7J8WSN1_GOSAI|nr:hypothetical protein [Gossypium aridum]
MERDLVALSLDDEEEEILHIQKESNSGMVEEYLCLAGNFLIACVIHFPAMRSTMANLWHPDGKDPLKVPLIFVNFWVQIHEVPPGFFFEALTRQIGDFTGKILEYDGSNLGKGNLSLRAQSKKALAMNSVWLRDDGDEIQKSSIKGREFGRCNWEVSDVEVGSSKIHEQIDMEHDGEDGAIEGGDGKKRPRIEDDRSLVGEEISALVLRNNRGLKKICCYRWLPRGKPTGRNKNNKLECPWIGESTGC